MNERAGAVWARTSLRVWPEEYRLISLPLSLLAEAAALLGGVRSGFAALVREGDLVSLTLPAEVWAASPLAARAESGPFRAITLDAEVDLDVCGYLAPAAERLAAAGVPIVPQCAYSKDHLLVPAKGLDTAVRVLQALISAYRS